MVVYGTKRHVLFVQALDISEKIMEKKVEWIYDLLENIRYLLGAVIARNQEIRVDFFQVAGRDQAREILANNKIESFLMATDGVNNQMAGQRKVLVRDIPLVISDKEVGAAIKEFGEKIIKQRKTWEAKLVDLPQNCTAYYLSTTLDQIKAQFCFILRTSKNYTKMGCAYIRFDSEANHNNATKKPLVIDCLITGTTPIQKPSSQVNNRKEQGKKGVNQSWKAEINELRKQVNKMAKLLNAVAAKFGVTIEKEKEAIVAQQPRKEEIYNSELEIKRIKKILEPILELLKQVKKQGSWGSSTVGESKFMETDNV
ncbi:hypothetical protein G9A89_006925 [Geosiphon pyriformis]|nr:hypothetical protein G9A89_006925 [Geosiphon pyriformis]